MIRSSPRIESDARIRAPHVKVRGRCLTLHLVEQEKQSNQAPVFLVEKAKVAATVASAVHLLESGSDIRTIQE